MKKRSWILSFFLLFTISSAHLVEARALPQLQKQDVLEIVEDLLTSHATYHQLTPQLVGRILLYVENLDPWKTYFLASEVAPWIDPSSNLQNQVLAGYATGDFSVFEEIHQAMVQAIHRHNRLEEKLAGETLLPHVKADEFKEIKWAEDEEALYQRLLKLKSLQAETLAKLSQETQEKVLQRICKRRINREKELLEEDPQEHAKLLYMNILKASAPALDHHTNYFTPAETNQFMMEVQQRLFGVGVMIRDDLNGFTIIQLLEGSSAFEDKRIRVQDRIIAINHEPVIGLDIEEVAEMIRGAEGTQVTLTLLRPREDPSEDLSEDSSEDPNQKEETPLEISLPRRRIVLSDTRLEVSQEPFGSGVIAHLTLYSFYQDSQTSSAKDLRKAIETIQKEHTLLGVILDLRHNGGGLLTQAVDVTGLFTQKGIVVSIKESQGSLKHLRNIEGNPVWRGPLLILTSKASASCAEIVAQTLQDWGRALVVGDAQTFGKGTFQVFTLDALDRAEVDPRGEYKITCGRYYTVSGKTPQLEGVQADIWIPGVLTYLDIGERHAKYPLENDTIEPHFIDNLEDLPYANRQKISWLYEFNMQQITTQYTQHVQRLKENAAERIVKNKGYQAFLKKLKGSDQDEDEAFTPPSEQDYQYQEALNVMKDLIFLTQQ